MTEKKKNVKQKVLLSGLVLGMLISGQSFAETQDEARSQIDFNNLQTVDSLLANKTLRASSNYDGRMYRYIPDKTVGSTNESWAIAATRMFEFNSIYSADYSERHLDYATALNSTAEGTPDAHYRNLGSGGNAQVALGYFTSGKGPIDEQDMKWQDNLNQVSLSDIQNKSVLQKIDDYTKFLSIYKYRENGMTYCWDRSMSYYDGGQIEQNREAIKEHIVKYGAVMSRIYRADQYFQYMCENKDGRVTAVAQRSWTSSETTHKVYYNIYKKKYWSVPGGLSYYCTEKDATPNHEVVIIGWDDNYTNDYTGAPKKGAYIAVDSDYFYKTWKDTLIWTDPSGYWNGYHSQYEAAANVDWGSEDRAEWKENDRWLWGSDGKYWTGDTQTTNTNVYYISYDDYFVESNVYGIGKTSYVDYDSIYQYDPLGMSTSVAGKYYNSSVYGANVYKRNTEVAQKLKEVSVASTMPLKYEVYVNPKDGDLSEEKLIKVATTDELEAGYHSIKLSDQGIMLTGEKFAVVVKYIADAESRNWQDQIAKCGVEAPMEVYYDKDGDTVVRKTKDIDFYQNATSTPTQSYMSDDMKEWTDLCENADTKNMNICIKAFVKDDPYYIPPVEKVEIDKTEMTMIKGDIEKLNAKVYPDNVRDSRVYWTSSNRNIATVDQAGNVTAVAGGEVVITARSSDANVFAECKVKVDVPVEKMVLNQKEVTILSNETHVLAPIISPEDATTQEVQWSSSNKDVCRVTDNGVLIGLKKGRAIITAIVKDQYGTHTATCTVVIPESLLVDVTGVKLNKTSTSIEKGNRETLVATVLPEDATNQEVVWTSSNKSVAVVNANGRVTAVSPGTTTITVTTVNRGETATCEVKVSDVVTVPVTGVSLSKTKLSLEKGQSETLSATITPSNSTNKNITWTSSNENVAVVNSSGKVSAIEAGSAVITAKSVDGGYTASCNVNVSLPIVRVTGLKLNKTGVTLDKEGTLSLIANVLPYDATNKEVTWESSNPEVATVDENGLVKAISSGDAIITAKTKDGNFEKTCLVSVTSNVAVTGITLDQTSLNMVTSRTIDLKASIEPVNATNKNIIWTSSDEEVAVVNSGKVVSLKAGSATITAKTEDGSFEATCEVTVEEQSGDITLTSYNYLISTDKVIYEVKKATTVENFLNNVIVNEGTTVQVIDREKNPVANDSYVGTGMTLKLTKTIEATAPEEGEGTEETTGGAEEGTEETPTIVTEEYVILVNGDIDGDGESNATDLSISINYVIGETELDSKYLYVIDLNNDGEITLSDIVLFRQKIIKN